MILVGRRVGGPAGRDSGALPASYRYAERVTAEWARSFYFASRYLPAEKRNAVFAIYDYCRHADNLVDRRGDRAVELVRTDLAGLKEIVRRLHRGERPDDRRWLALWDTLGRFPVPLAPLIELVDGVAMDLDVVEFQDFPALERYCRLVAGGVGLMLGPILGAQHEGFGASGVRLGVAMQLTNVLRDVGEDLDAGRVYLPASELRRFGLGRGDLQRRRVTPAFRALMRFQIDRARRYFEAGSRVVGRFPPDGSRLTVRLLQTIYAGILDAIERLDYDVFRARAYVSTPRKLMILGRAMWSERAGHAAITPSERSA